MIKPEFGKARCVDTAFYETKVSAESRIAVGQEVKKELSTSATAFVVGTENKNGKTIVDVKTAFRLVYLAEDGFKKADAFAETQVEIPFENALAKAIAVGARTVRKADGLVAKCSIEIKASALVEKQATALVGGDRLRTKERAENFDSVGNFSFDKFVVTEEFDVDYAVKEVLTNEATVDLREVTATASGILFEGEIGLSLKATPFSDDRDVTTERRTIPFRFELSDPDSSLDASAIGDCEIEKIAFKVYADEGKGVSSVGAEISLSFSGAIVESQTFAFADDVYSIDGDADVQTTEFASATFTGLNQTTEKITVDANGEIPPDGKIIAEFGSRARTTDVVKQDGGYSIVGIVEADLLFKNADNGFSATKAQAPFSLSVSSSDEIYDVETSLLDFSAAAKEGSISFDCKIKASYKSFKRNYYQFITSVEERVGKKNDDAISVLIPQKGDELWDVAKKLRTDENEIMRFNNELEFPLSGEERIVVYRQKKGV